MFGRSRKRSTRKSSLQQAARFAVEALEERRYFITLGGGDEFIFLDPRATLADPNQIRVRLTGNITADIVGAYPTQFGDVGLTEIPGSLNGTPILGGIGGVGGTRLLGTPGAADPVTGISGGAGIDIVDTLPNGISVPFDSAGSDAINVRGIANNSATNVMYGFNIISGADGGTDITGSRIQLVRFDSIPGDGRGGNGSVIGTVIADLTGALLNPANGAEFNVGDDHVATALQGVTAAEFNPVDGRLYFVVQGTETIQLDIDTTGTVSIPQLFSVDISAAGISGAATVPNANAIAGSLDRVNTNFGYAQSITVTGGTRSVITNEPIVDSITFDQTSSTSANFYAVVHRLEFTASGGGQSATSETVTRLFRGTNANGVTAIAPAERMTYLGENINTITGISFGPDDPTVAAEIIYAVTSSNTTESSLGESGAGGGDGGGGDTGQQLFEFDLTQPVGGALPGLAIGFLPDLSDTDDPIRGEDLQGLTYNPLAPDPISGTLGAFVGVDATSDELVTISLSRRFAVADIFHIYISAADRDASIGVVYYDATPTGFVERPYDDADLPNLPFSTPDGLELRSEDVGNVWIGGRITTIISHIPFTEAEYPIDETYGLIPRPTSNILTAGIVSADGVDMGNILIGGLVTGEVNMGGSLETFYSGQLLTGEVLGTGLGSVTRPANFTVNGDLSSLVTKHSIGSLLPLAPGDIEQYATGFEAIVQGEIGHFSSVLGSVLGSVLVENGAGGYSDADLEQREYEVHTGDDSGENMLDGLLGAATADAAFLYNDTLENPQYLNSIGEDNANGHIRVVGSLDDVSDIADVYAITLMAGQIVTVQNRGGSVSVYDPDGRNIASDSSHLGANIGRAFKFTADRPGIYKFMCAGTGYELNIQKVGNVAMGGVSAGLDIWNARSGESYRIGSGHMGALYAGASISFGSSGGQFFNYTPNNASFDGQDDVRTVAGEIRAVDASSIGLNTNVTFGNFNIQSDAADVGLIRARAGFLTVSSAHIGGSLQVFEAFGTGSMYLKALEGMGAFRAGDTISAIPGYLRLNADEAGSDGVLGLIDVAGDWGSIPGDTPIGQTPANFNNNGSDSELPNTGGAPIRTGQAGNVRYMHVGGAVYQDEFFSLGAPTIGRGSDTTFDAGIAKSFIDDGGGEILITPLGLTEPNPAAIDPITGLIDPTIDPLIGPALTIITYGVRGSGGVVLIDASVFGPNVEGLRIDGSSIGGRRGSVEIGTLAVRGLTGLEGTALELNADGVPILPGGTSRDSGRTRGPLVVDPITGVATKTESGSTIGTAAVPLTIQIGGSARVDVFSIEGRSSEVNAAADELTNSGASGGSAVAVLDSITYAGNFTRIANATGGSMVRVRAGDIAVLSSVGSIGVSDYYEGVALNPAGVAANDYPFVQQRSGIVATNLGYVQSQSAVGNLIVSGAINSVWANVDDRNDTNVFEGISGPIVAGANLGYVMVGEGLASSGSGTVGLSGIYAGGIIHEVRNQGLGSDLYGDIISLQEIRRINLRDGSIINSDIQVASSYENGIDGPGLVGLFPGGSGNESRPFYVIGSIGLTGRGGIIGTKIAASNIGNINVVDGFGIFSSEIYAIGNSTINRIETDGYGMRYNQIQTGSNLNVLNARGNGQSLPTDRYSPTVRFSETQPVDEFYGVTFDPFTGFATNFLTDIHSLLGTSAAAPVIEGVTNAGIIENTSVRGFRNLGTATAFQFRTRDISALPETANEFPTELNFAAQIGAITTRSLIDGLSVTTGRLKRFVPNGDVYRLQMTVSGSISSVKIKGTLGDNSEIFAIGSSAVIGTVTVLGDMDGTLRASSRINKIAISGQLTGNIQVDNRTGVTNIGSLSANRGVGPDNLTIDGSIGKVVIGYDANLGTPGGTLTVNGNLSSMVVKGGKLDSSLVVAGNLGALVVRGEMSEQATITVGGDAKKFVFANAVPASDVVRGAISVAGNIGTFSVTGGNVTASITAGGTFGTFSQSRGNIGFGTFTPGVLPTISAGERFGVLKTTGNLNANIAAGLFGKVVIKGDLGDGVTAIAATSASSWNVLNVSGSIKTGSTTTINGPLAQLVVAGNVETGSSVTATEIRRKVIRGLEQGTVTP